MRQRLFKCSFVALVLSACAANPRSPNSGAPIYTGSDINATAPGAPATQPATTSGSSAVGAAGASAQNAGHAGGAAAAQPSAPATPSDAGAAGMSASNPPHDARVPVPDGGMPRSDSGTAGVGAATDSGAVVPSSAGYLHTDGGDIVDAQGHVVRLTGLSWFGMETTNYAPHGLWSKKLSVLLDQIKSLGYNMIRLPFCSQFFDTGSTPNGIDANPDLNGLKGLALLDKIIAGATQRGLKIVLDRHRPDSGAQSALWYTSQYTEQRWIDDWKMLATHYKGNTTVIGFDLHNEPHDPATWGDGNMQTDWRLAAERAGNAVLAINPDLLIIVEGVQTVGTSGYWWGGNLRGVMANPVRLNVAQRVVYSPHDYPSSVNAQPWFSDTSYPNNLPRLWDDTWGYIAASAIAPIWIGEFGTKDETSSDKQWFAALASYIAQHKLSFSYWCLNPNSGDTGGILKDDWSSVNSDKQSVIQPLLAPLIP